MTEATDFWLQFGPQLMRSTLVVLGLLSLRLALSKWLAPRWLYGICLLGALWLLLPMTPSSPLSIWQLLAPSADPEVTWTVQTGGTIESYSAPMVSALPSAPIAPAASGSSSSSPVNSSPPAAQPSAAPTALWLLWIWAAGAGLLLGFWLWQELRFLWRLRLEAQPATDPQLLELMADAKERMEIHREVTLIHWSSPLSPALAGMLKPTILIQENLSDQLEDEQIRQIFMHELGHLKRHDLLTQALLRLTAILHWYNPVATWLCRAAHRDRELATDALVLHRLAPDQRHSYGSTLLHVARLVANRKPRLSIGLMGMASPQLKNLKTRIHMIDQPTQARWATALACLGTLLLTLCIGFQPAVAQDGKDLPPANERDIQGDLRISAEFYELPAAAALNFTSQNKAGTLSPDAHAELTKLSQTEEGKLISTPTVICRSGQRAKVEGGKTMRFLTAYEIKDEQEVPKYSELFVGSHLEVDSVLGPEGKLIDVNFIVAHSIDPEVTESEVLTPLTKTMAKVQIPQENRAYLVTASTFEAGTSKIVGTATSPSDPGRTIIFVLSADVY